MGQHFAHGAGADDAAGATVGEAGGEAAVRKPRRGHAVLIAVLSVLVALAIALAAGGTSLVGSAQALPRQVRRRLHQAPRPLPRLVRVGRADQAFGLPAGEGDVGLLMSALSCMAFLVLTAAPP